MDCAACLLILSGLAGPIAAPPAILSPADEAAAFRAAGFQRVGDQWQGCGDPGTESYTPGAVESVGDLNGDGLPEAILTEGSVHCFGMTGVGYAITSKQASGGWILVTEGMGMITVLKTTGSGGWRDLEIGGPGFCFPVQRWNGREYVLHRHQYDGKPCKPA